MVYALLCTTASIFLLSFRPGPGRDILKEQGICLEELVESGREIRGEMVEEDYGLEGEEDH